MTEPTLTPGQKFAAFLFSIGIAGMIFMALLALAGALFSGCVISPPIHPPTPPPAIARQVVITVRGQQAVALWASGTLWDDAGRTVGCGHTTDPRVLCRVPEEMPQGNGFHLGLDSPGYIYRQMDFVSCTSTVPTCYPTQDLSETYLDPVKPPQPPIGPKADFWTHYQGDFGTKKIAGCGLHMDALFDPYLLERWVNNRPCFEQMMARHAAANDNRVVVGPRSGYHGFNDIDLWHDPETVAAFLADVRSRTNAVGEHFKVMVALGAYGHLPEMRADANYQHWQRDIAALAAVTQDLVDATQECWECRHQGDFTSAKRYVDMGRFIAQQWPRAVHAEHLIVDSSSWSSWRCDPAIPGSCQNPSDGPPANDADDPNRGNETNAWWNCRREGWCDLFLFQFHEGSEYLYPTPGADALERWREIVERLGDDPRSLATSGGNRHGWPQVPVLAWEEIYDAYWMRDGKATEAYAIEFCQKALALGGWGCGSASWRLP